MISLLSLTDYTKVLFDHYYENKFTTIAPPNTPEDAPEFVEKTFTYEFNRGVRFSHICLRPIINAALFLREQKTYIRVALLIVDIAALVITLPRLLVGHLAKDISIRFSKNGTHYSNISDKYVMFLYKAAIAHKCGQRLGVAITDFLLTKTEIDSTVVQTTNDGITKLLIKKMV